MTNVMHKFFSVCLFLFINRSEHTGKNLCITLVIYKKSWEICVVTHTKLSGKNKNIDSSSSVLNHIYVMKAEFLTMLIIRSWSGMWHCIVFMVGTRAANEPAASYFGVEAEGVAASETTVRSVMSQKALHLRNRVMYIYCSDVLLYLLFDRIKQ